MKNKKIILLGLLVILLIISITAYIKVSVYQVIFYSDGNLYETIEVRKNKTITPPKNPTKEGYIFIGWFDSEGNGFDFKEKVNQNIVLSAGWGKLATE